MTQPQAGFLEIGQGKLNIKTLCVSQAQYRFACMLGVVEMLDVFSCKSCSTPSLQCSLVTFLTLFASTSTEGEHIQ